MTMPPEADQPVHCPFAGGPCTAAPDVDGNPTCPSVRERVCVNGLDDE